MFLSIIPLGFPTALSTWWKGLFWVLAFSGVLLSLATWRRVEWAMLRNSAGTETVTIARAGKDRDSFESFVPAVIAAVTARQNVGGMTAPNNSLERTRAR